MKKQRVLMMLIVFCRVPFPFHLSLRFTTFVEIAQATITFWHITIHVAQLMNF
jgi:hypothetical protein